MESHLNFRSNRLNLVLKCRIFDVVVVRETVVV